MSSPEQVIAAFSEEQVERLTGVSKGQLRYWDKTDFYKPSYSEGRPIAFGRIYSFKDIVALRVLGALRQQYQVSLQHLREVSERLSGAHEDRWVGVRLWPLNRRVVWQDPDTALPQDILSKQFVVPLHLDEVVSQARADVKRMTRARPAARLGKIEKNRYIQQNAPVIAGTRIPVSSIKSFAEAGYSPEEIIAEYPDLTPEDIAAALAFKSDAA
jgi:uncharacterized protein (DUF433 family)